MQKGFLFTGGQPPLPTGVLLLDLALGGGLPAGAFVEITGPAESGKSSLCLSLLRQGQHSGRFGLLVDGDHTFDPAYAQRSGVQLSQLWLAQPTTLEEALDILARLSAAGPAGLLILEGLEALPVCAELERPFGAPSDPWALPSSSALSEAIKRMAQHIRRTGSTVIFTHRDERRPAAAYHGLRDHLDRLGLSLQAAVRIKLEPLAAIKAANQPVGQHIRAQITKSGYKSPIKLIDFDIMYSQGVIRSSAWFDLGLQLGILQQKGQQFSFEGVQLGSERHQAIHLMQRLDLEDRIEQAIRQQLFPTNDACRSQEEPVERP
jgi:recombination protein RecA